jgi:hypothetical protein
MGDREGGAGVEREGEMKNEGGKEDEMERKERMGNKKK